jgi:hypothetical protein
MLCYCLRPNDPLSAPRARRPPPGRPLGESSEGPRRPHSGASASGAAGPPAQLVRALTRSDVTVRLVSGSGDGGAGTSGSSEGAGAAVGAAAGLVLGVPAAAAAAAPPPKRRLEAAVAEALRAAGSGAAARAAAAAAAGARSAEEGDAHRRVAFLMRWGFLFDDVVGDEVGVLLKYAPGGPASVAAGRGGGGGAVSLLSDSSSEDAAGGEGDAGGNGSGGAGGPRPVRRRSIARGGGAAGRGSARRGAGRGGAAACAAPGSAWGAAEGPSDAEVAAAASAVSRAGPGALSYYLASAMHRLAVAALFGGFHFRLASEAQARGRRARGQVGIAHLGLWLLWAYLIRPLRAHTPCMAAPPFLTPTHPQLVAVLVVQLLFLG